MEASIIEVLPRGVFAVRALQTVKIGSQETRFELLGNLREKDIDSTDVANSDAILNLSLAASLGGKGYQPIDSLVSALEVAANTPPAATPSANSSPVASAANSSPPATAPSSNASEGGPTNNNNSGDKK